MGGSGDFAQIVPNANATLITIDFTSRLLFWTTCRTSSGALGDFWEIFFSDMNGKDVRLTISLTRQPAAVYASGNRLYWISRTTKT